MSVENASIIIHNEVYDYDYTFGILKINMGTSPSITENHQHIEFTIDNSWSMEDPCQDGRKKLQHILYTLENMLRTFHNTTDTTISVCIRTFSDSATTIVDTIPNIRDIDINQLIEKINTIHSQGLTNIEDALLSANASIYHYSTNNPTHDITHIFLTDGKITRGSRDVSELMSYSPKGDKITNVFIGYGDYHDANVLCALSRGLHNEYRFVDKLENAGLIYGEIIFNTLYYVYKNVTLVCTNRCEIYDYDTNTWNNILQVNRLVSEQERVFHIRIPTYVDSNQIEVSIETQDNTEIARFVKAEDTQDLTKYVMRQKTLELLFRANSIAIEKNGSLSSTMNDDDDSQPLTMSDLRIDIGVEGRLANIKSEMGEFHKVLSEYLTEVVVEDKPFIQNLMDDIAVAIVALDTEQATMYTNARQQSQGQQYSYNCNSILTQTQTQTTMNNTPMSSQPDFDVNDLDTLPPAPVRLGRTATIRNGGMLTTYSQTQTHTYSQTQTQDYNLYSENTQQFTPYSTNGTLRLMREISQHTNVVI